MFTGLVESTGSVVAIAPRVGTVRLTVAAPRPLVERLKTGDSIAVSGVCLTALNIMAAAEPAHFSADLAAETVARTSLSRLAPGSLVNLELPTPAGTPLGGHIVQGHVDGVGTLVALEPVSREADPATTDWWLRISVPAALTRYIVEKGSITLEGISLTVAAIETGTVTIAVIPHTYAATNLHTILPGAEVNIETDVLARYAEQLSNSRPSAPAASPRFELTLPYLIANGY